MCLHKYHNIRIFGKIRQKNVLLIIVFMIIVTGVYAQPILKISEPAVQNILNQIH